MFDHSAPAELIDVMGVAARAESAAIARRLGAVARLFAHRRAEDAAESQFWSIDVFEEVAAEVSAAQNISRARAGAQVRKAVELFERLPAVAAVFATGDIDYRMACLVLSRTDNVEDDLIGQVDAALARHVSKWMRLSKTQLRDRLDLWVAKFDPAAVRVPPAVRDNRYFDVEPHVPGMALAGGLLDAADATALDQRLDAIASTVCARDPRTAGQRRADACGALGRGEAALACRCGQDECPAVAVRETAGQVVIHVLAEQATVDGRGDHPGYLPGLGVLPAESVRQLAKVATLQPVPLPGAAVEAGYRPSAGLAEFIRWRDLTCRFPGCDAPVQVCDTDHTVPWPFGATHASGLKLFCRTHHLLKTFYTGPGGWNDQQLADGTIVFTAPTGHVYTTQSHGGMLFGALATPTAPVATATPPAKIASQRAAMMPRRTATRDQDRRDRIARERRQRLEINAEQYRQRQAWLAATYEPPPF